MRTLIIVLIILSFTLLGCTKQPFEPARIAQEDKNVILVQPETVDYDGNTQKWDVIQIHTN